MVNDDEPNDVELTFYIYRNVFRVIQICHPLLAILIIFLLFHNIFVHTFKLQYLTNLFYCVQVHIAWIDQLVAVITPEAVTLFKTLKRESLIVSLIIYKKVSERHKFYHTNLIIH